MSLPEPNFSYKSQNGFVARMSRIDLEKSSLGRDRTPQEEVAYWRWTVAELQSEFPSLTFELGEAKRKLALAQEGE